MARTPSNMIPLGTQAPDFDLIDVVTSEARSYDDISGSEARLSCLSVITALSLSILKMSSSNCQMNI
jgi:hypothetical protein